MPKVERIDFSEETIEAGEQLFKGACEFVLSVVEPSGLPPADRMEIAFAGRSNVGKSSLINALLSRKSLARTSNTPGRTQTLNFYALGAPLYLVDLPGYGYAKVSRKTVEAWTALIFTYLKGRANLTRVFLLIDARHGAKASDEEAMRALDGAAVSFQAVLTKVDKVGEADRAAVEGRLAEVLARHPAAHPHIIATSSRDRLGLAELRAAVAELMPR